MLFAIISVLGYALDGVFMSRYYRKFAGMLSVAMRGLCLGITMSPLLLMVEPDAIEQLPKHLPTLFLACCMACVANWCFSQALLYFPVGVTCGLSLAIQVVCLSILSEVFLGDRLTAVQIILILFLIINNLIIGSQNYSSGFALKNNKKMGAVFSVLMGVFISGAFFLMVSVSRSLSPFMAAYIWEFGIGIIASILFVCLRLIGRIKKVEISFRDCLGVLFSSAPTVMGTGGYAVASTQLPVTIVSAIGSSSIVVASILAGFVHKEILTRRQWIHVFLAVVMIAAFKLIGLP